MVLVIQLAFGSLGILIAIRTGTAEGLQGIVALALALLFLSSMAMPRNLITVDWFKTVATYNPMSYLVEAPRSLLIGGWDGEALAMGCGIAGAIAVLALAAASATLERRVARA